MTVLSPASVSPSAVRRAGEPAVDIAPAAPAATEALPLPPPPPLPAPPRASAEVAAAARGRAAADDARARARARPAADVDASAAVRRGLDAQRDAPRRLDATNIARRDNFTPALTPTITPGEGYEPATDAPEPAASSCTPAMRCPSVDVAALSVAPAAPPPAPVAAAAAAVVPPAPPAGGARRLDATNIARRDNAALPPSPPLARAPGFELATDAPADAGSRRAP